MFLQKFFLKRIIFFLLSLLIAIPCFFIANQYYSALIITYTSDCDGIFYVNNKNFKRFDKSEMQQQIEVNISLLDKQPIRLEIRSPNCTIKINSIGLKSLNGPIIHFNLLNSNLENVNYQIEGDSLLIQVPDNQYANLFLEKKKNNIFQSQVVCLIFSFIFSIVLFFVCNIVQKYICKVFYWNLNIVKCIFKEGKVLRYTFLDFTILFWIINFFSLFKIWTNAKFLLFYDEGADCTLAFWPFAELAYRWLQSPSHWLYELGLGTPSIAMQGYGFLNPLTLFSIIVGNYFSNIAYSHILIWSLHAYVGGIGMFFFFRINKLPNIWTIIFSLIYAYSSMMVGYGTWDSALNVTITAYAPYVLLVVELYFRNRKWYYLPWPIVIIAISSLGAYFLYQIFIFTFFYISYRCITDFSLLSNRSLKGFIILLFRIYMPLFLGILIAAPVFFPFLNYGMSEIARAPSLGLATEDLSRLGWDMLLYRLLNLSIISPNSYYSNIGQYFYEAPFYSISCIVLPLIVSILWKSSFRQKTAIVILLSPWVLTLLNVSARHIFHVVSPYHRFTGTFWTISILIVCGQYLYLSFTNKRHIFIYALLFFPLLLISLYSLSLKNLDIRFIFVAFWCSFLMFYIYYFYKNFKCPLLLLLIVCLQLGIDTYSIVIKDRALVGNYMSVGSPDKITDKLYDELNFLKNYSGPYRLLLSNSNPYASLNFSSVFGIMGFNDYFSYNIALPLKFFHALDIPTNAQFFAFDKDIPHTLAGILGGRYLIDQAGRCQDSVAYRSPPLFSHGNNSFEICQNPFWVPFGSIYYQALPYKEWQSYESEERINTLYSAVISDELSGFFSKNFTPLTTEELVNEAKNKIKSGFSITHFSEDQISGNISSDRLGIAVFPIPYVKGWTARVDGIENKIFPVNIAFMGILLDEGEHTIELKYSTPWLKESCFISLLSLILYFTIYFRTRQKVAP